MTKMEKERAVFDAVSGIDPVLVQEAAEVKKKKNRPVSAGRILWKAAACLVLVVGLLAMLYGLPGANGGVEPYFLVYVYAEQNEKVELNSNGETFVNNGALSGVGGHFSSSFGDNVENQLEVGCCFEIELSDNTRDYNDIVLYCNGEEVVQGDKRFLFIHTIDVTNGKHKGITISCKTEEPVMLQILLKGDNGEILQQVDLSITPMEEGYSVKLVELMG